MLAEQSWIDQLTTMWLNGHTHAHHVRCNYVYRHAPVYTAAGSNVLIHAHFARCGLTADSTRAISVEPRADFVSSGQPRLCRSISAIENRAIQITSIDGKPGRSAAIGSACVAECVEHVEITTEELEYVFMA